MIRPILGHPRIEARGHPRIANLRVCNGALLGRLRCKDARSEERGRLFFGPAILRMA